MYINLKNELLTYVKIIPGAAKSVKFGSVGP